LENRSTLEAAAPGSLLTLVGAGAVGEVGQVSEVGDESGNLARSKEDKWLIQETAKQKGKR
jgi:hypothetical protein